MTVTLPHGHIPPRSRRLFSLIAVLAGCLTALPALAAPPAEATAPTEAAAALPTTTATTSAAAISTPASAPEAAVLPALPKTAPIATPDTAPSVPAATAGGTIKTVLQRAFTLLGTPYRYGGSSPERGFDCSGLVSYVFRTIGIDLPRMSRAMAQEGTRIVGREALSEGDLVFFGRRGHVDHVGIYIGNGQFLHAPRTGRDVTVSSLSEGYWANKFIEARRLMGSGD
ncbi:C40 family peptidase [Thermomonas hydrothermalis]|uniref:Cell wall-associated hydrolase, NlpC family n=1 Tax=Thermomonas hydrothermalis TaxID=213588 RepID=A0A1M4S4U4_9GAMM|nr:Cell wall-associated hydrolase, NlpC family [Thermomonas hydrothermalis]